jgi:hypothetical protein
MSAKLGALANEGASAAPLRGEESYKTAGEAGCGTIESASSSSIRDGLTDQTNGLRSDDRGVRRKPHADSGNSGKLGLEHLVDLFGSGSKHEVSVVESRHTDRSVLGVVLEEPYPLDTLLTDGFSGSNDQLG